MTYNYIEYIPELNDRVKLSNLAYEYINGKHIVFRNFYDPGSDMLGTVSETKIDVGDGCEMEVKIKWDNGILSQYPMSFLTYFHD